MKKLLLFFVLLSPLPLLAQDTAKVIYGDARYMQATFKTKNNFQVYDLKKCDGPDCPPNGLFMIYADSAQKKRLYQGEFVNGLREGVWSYFDKNGNTVCEEEYTAGRLLRYTIYREGTEQYERTFKAPVP